MKVSRYWLIPFLTMAIVLMLQILPCKADDKGWNPGETIPKIARGANVTRFWKDKPDCCNVQGEGFFTLETQWGFDRNFGKINADPKVSPWGFQWGKDPLDNQLYAALTTNTSKLFTPNNVYIGFHENLPQPVPNTWFGGNNPTTIDRAMLTAQLAGTVSQVGLNGQARWMVGLLWWVPDPPLGEPHSFVIEINLNSSGGPPQWSTSERVIDNSTNDIKSLYLGSRYWCDEKGLCSKPSTGFKGILNSRTNVWVDWKNIVEQLRCDIRPLPVCVPDWAIGPFTVTSQYIGQESFGDVIMTLYVKYFRQM